MTETGQTGSDFLSFEDEADELLRKTPPPSPSGDDVEHGASDNRSTTGSDTEGEYSLSDEDGDGSEDSSSRSPDLAQAGDQKGFQSPSPGPGPEVAGANPEDCSSKSTEIGSKKDRPSSAPAAGSSNAVSGSPAIHPAGVRSHPAPGEGAQACEGQVDPAAAPAGSLQPPTPLKEPETKVFIPITGPGSSAPPNGSILKGPVTTAPPFFSGRESGSARVPTHAPPPDGAGGSWCSELTNIGDHYGIAVSAQATPEVVQHEAALGHVTVTTKRMPFHDLRMSDDFQVTTPAPGSQYKVSVTYLTDLSPPAYPIIAHETYGPFALNGLSRMVRDGAQLVKNARRFYLDHVLQTRHSIINKNIQHEDIYVNVSAIPWQGSLISKFPKGIPYPCLNQQVTVANAPLENGFFTLSLQCRANSHKQYLPPVPVLPEVPSSLGISSPAPARPLQAPATPPQETAKPAVPKVIAKPANDSRQREVRPPPDGRRPREDRRPRADGDRSKDSSDKDRKRDQREKSRSSKGRKRSKSSSKRKGEKKKKHQHTPATAPSVESKVVVVRKPEVQSPPLPAPDAATHPLGMRKDALMAAPSW